MESSRVSFPADYDLLLYHAACMDGFGAAWIAAQRWPGIELHAVAHGCPPPLVTGRRVLLADFSYPRPIMEALRATATTLTVLDHHRTALDDLQDFPQAMIDITQSGMALTWAHAYPGMPRPILVDYIEDRDLLQWALPHSREVNAVISSVPFSLPRWDALDQKLQTQWKDVLCEGPIILQFQERLIHDILPHAVRLYLGDHEALGVHSNVLQSEIAETLSHAAPIGVTWFQTATGDFVYSLRTSHPDAPDVAQIAQLYGGGGHQRSAGFRRPTLLPTYGPARVPLFNAPPLHPTVPCPAQLKESAS